MGNGASSQGSIPSHDRRDVGTSIVKEQHDWQEQAVAPRQETLSLPDGRKPYKSYCQKFGGFLFLEHSVVL